MTNRKTILSQTVLPPITQRLTELSYTDIRHQRISQSHDAAGLSYQGLTRARHSGFGQVMVKWVTHSEDDNNVNNKMALASDIAVMTDLDTKNITPPLLHQHQLPLNLDNQPLIFFAIVMPYYKKGNLAQMIRQPIPNGQKHRFIVQSAQLLAGLHQRGWLHNDIKPSNILLSHDNLLLTDFALSSKLGDKKNNLSIAGTPAYLAPERWQGWGATVQSEVYAFGTMMFEILSGERPFNTHNRFSIHNNSHDKAQAWAVEHCQSPVPKLSDGYQSYQQIIDKALAKRAANRYQDMDKVLNDLRQV